MIYEYALDPELVAKGHDKYFGRILLDNFGLGKSRIVSKLPKSWKANVYAVYTGGDIAKKRVEELILHLSERMSQRPNGCWDGTKTWMENVQLENTRHPLHALVSLSNPNNQNNIISEDKMISGDHPLWQAPRSTTVNRISSDMALCVKPLLMCASKIIFIDPHFRASKIRFRKPLEEFLKIIATRKQKGLPISIELCVSATPDNHPNWRDFESECNQYLPNILPSGLSINIYYLRDKTGREQMHNRYILSDIGGLKFGTGLDEGDSGTTDDVDILDIDNFNNRIAIYSFKTENGKPVCENFDIEGSVTISS